MAKKKSSTKSPKATKPKSKSTSKKSGKLGDLMKLFQKKNAQWIDNMSESNIYVFASYGPSCTENSYTPSACCPSIGFCPAENFCM